MIISCERCQARFRLADDKLKPGGTRVRCSKCQLVFTVMPPEAVPAEEPVDFGAFNMERIGDEESVPPPAAPQLTVPAADDRTAEESGAREFDFSTFETTTGPETDSGAFAGETPPPGATGQDTPPDLADIAPIAATGVFGELDFTAELPDRGETGRAATPPPDAAAPAVNGDGAAADSARFSFDSEESAAADVGLAAGVPREEFPFAADAGRDEFAFGTETEAAAGRDSFSFGEEGETDLFKDAPAFGAEDAAAWADAGTTKDVSFDFDEPSFAGATRQPSAGSGAKPDLNFGEIDFGEAPQPAGEPQPPPAGPDTVPPPPPPPSRAAAPRRAAEEPAPPSLEPRKGPGSRVLLLLVLLLLLLCGAGAYFYLLDDGQQLARQLMTTLKGEQPDAPVEQRIGLVIAGSSYLDNREAGQLLVIQGSATNNFAGARSAIAVKGVLIDANDKVLQQQTVFCGNYLSEEKLRTMKYAQIEEAMNNQFGDSLANMNVKPGAAIRFTIVFRNLPQNLANINVEVVDSRPGGL